MEWLVFSDFVNCSQSFSFIILIFTKNEILIINKKPRKRVSLSLFVHSAWIVVVVFPPPLLLFLLFSLFFPFFSLFSFL